MSQEQQDRCRSTFCLERNGPWVSQGVPACWVWSLGQSKNWEEEKLKDQRVGLSYLIRVFCYRAGDERWWLGTGVRGREKVCRQPTWFSGRPGLWINRENLLELRAEKEQPTWPTSMLGWGWGVLPMVSSHPTFSRLSAHRLRLQLAGRAPSLNCDRNSEK